jgi:hypothetical protein
LLSDCQPRGRNLILDPDSIDDDLSPHLPNDAYGGTLLINVDGTQASMAIPDGLSKTERRSATQ